MNDAVVEAAAPDAKQIAEIAERLNQLLRLRSFPIGMPKASSTFSEGRMREPNALAAPVR